MKLIILSLLILSAHWMQGQQIQLPEPEATQNDIPLIFQQDDFEGRLSVLALSFEDYNYFVVDLTNFTDRLERIYFLNLAYAESQVVSINHDVEGEQLWFKAHFQYPEADIHCLFAEMKEESRGACSAMTSEEKASWLSRFDKYHKQ